MSRIRPFVLVILLGFTGLLLTSSGQRKRVPEYSLSDLLGNIDPSDHPDFDRIKSRYTTKEAAYMREEAYDAFKEMWSDAKDDGVELTIISATRNRNYQKGIWNRKWQSYPGEGAQRAAEILKYSSMPGTSRHHWGTDVDFNALENSYFESGEGAIVYAWLQENAYKYGFFQPYTAFSALRDMGYQEEKWHWSYYPISSKFLRAYLHLVDYDKLTDFTGSEYARELDVINRYVRAIEVDPRVRSFKGL